MEEKPRPTWQIILRSGILGGGIAAYLCLVGLVEAFSERFLIGSFLTLGEVMLVTGILIAGLLTARELKDNKILATGSSLLSGVVSSLPLILLIFITMLFVLRPEILGATYNLRDMFVNLSPELVEILTLGQGLDNLALGILLLILLSALMSLLGAAFVLLPRRWSLGLISGIAWVLVIGIFSDTVSQIVRQVAGQGMIRVIFVNEALTPQAAVIIFAIAFVTGFFSVHTRIQTRWEGIPQTQQSRTRMILLLAAFGFLLVLPWVVGLFLSQALFTVGLFVMMCLGLNIVVGYAGLLDLGYVAFFAFGAYTMGILTTTGSLGRGGLNFWMAIPFCILVGVVWGLILGFPVLRLRGDYLAIVTLGFGEIIRILALSDWLAPFEGGAQGVLHIPYPNFLGIIFDSPQYMYYVVIAGGLIAAFVTIRLRESRLGRQWMAMREDEDVAEAMGINLVQTKLLAFAIGASFGALAGGVWAARLGNIFPHSFNLLISINALAVIIIGGMGSIPGVIIGALVLVGMPELLREFTEYRYLMYGILLIIMMLVRPEGLLPEATRRRELHTGEDENFEPVSQQPVGSDR
ncbi:MAG: leucine/isoleucine/valine transporter permease subunit [Chloroflexota bacterium]|nr:MAG: leucine/isoleucine/valine transporter permease subunit [Chloroflexota bacterium]